MVFGASLEQLLYAGAALSALLLAPILWTHRDRPGAVPLLVTVVGATWWSTSLFLVTLVPGTALSFWLYKSLFVGVVVVVAGTLLFALEYTGRSHLVTRKTVALLSIEPILVLGILVVEPQGLFLTDVPPMAEMNLDRIGFGPAFWAHTAYSYALTAVTTIMIVDMLYRTRAMYRGQIIALVAGLGTPTVANFLTISGTIDFAGGPAGFAVANVLFTVAVVRYRLIDLTPIARDRVVENVHDAVIVVDVEDRIIDLNPAGRELLAGATSGEPVGADASALIDLVSDLSDHYDAVMADGQERSFEFSVDDRHFDVDATPIEDGRDRQVGCLFLVRDVTEQRQRERELKRRNEQLDRFASVVSHDLRNPLNVAQGRLQLAQETGEAEHFESVASAHTRMEDIIDDVLTLARQGETVTEPVSVSLRASAESAWENLDTEGLALDVAEDATLEADRDRLTRLLENLFRNAREHAIPEADEVGRATDGGAPVTVEVGPLTESGEVVGFYVADDGVGIPPEKREEVLESGYSTSDDGTGFGLAIVQEIARAHGWSITVTKSDGGGARFEFGRESATVEA